MGKNKNQKNKINNLILQPKIDYKQIDTLISDLKGLEIEVKRILGHLGMDTYREELRSRMQKVEKKE